MTRRILALFPKNSDPLLKFNLGFWQTYLNKYFSYSQQGSYSSPSVEESTGDIVATGPSTGFPLARLRIATLTMPDGTLLIVIVFGQSNANGATSQDEDGVELTNTVITTAPPLPGKLLMPVGGFVCHQLGAGSPANSVPIDSAQYLGRFVDAKEGVNAGRDPTKLVFRETPGTAFCERVAAAVNDTCKVVGFSRACGSSSFAEIIQKATTVTSATWAAGVATFNFAAGSSLIELGETFIAKNMDVAGYDGTLVATAVTASSVQASMPVNPGSAATSGTLLFRAQPLRDARAIALHAKSETLDPESNLYGLTPRLYAVYLGGHEGNSTISSNEALAVSLDTLRSEMDTLSAEINAAAPLALMVHPQVGKPRGDHHETDISVSGTASYWALGCEAYSLTDSNYITYSTYAYSAGADSNINAVHYDNSPGHSEIGEKGALLAIDKTNGTGLASLPTIVDGSLVRVGSSLTITGTLSGSFIEAPSTYGITDPGNKGVQFECDGALCDISSVTVNGSDITIQLSTLPPSGILNKVGVAYKNATEYLSIKNNTIINATWAGGIATYTTSTPHGLVDGDLAPVAFIDPSGYDHIGTHYALAGTSGVTLTLDTPVDPGPYISGGAIARSAKHGLGRKHGNRSTLMLSTVRHYSHRTGRPLADHILHHLRDVVVYSSLPGMLAAIAELNLDTYPLLLDFGSAGCIANGASTTAVNLGTSGSVNDFLLNSMTFNGTADASVYNRSRFLSSTGSGFLSPINTPDVMATTHQAGGGVSWCIAGYKATISNAQYLAATGQMEGGGAAAGSSIRMASNGTLGYLVKDDVNATVYSANGGVVPNNSYFEFMGSIKDGETQGWIRDNINGVQFDNVIYGQGSLATPSVNPAQSLLHLGINGSTGSRDLDNGMRLYIVAMTDAFIPYERMLALNNTVDRRQDDLYV